MPANWLLGKTLARYFEVNAMGSLRAPIFWISIFLVWLISIIFSGMGGAGDKYFFNLVLELIRVMFLIEPGDKSWLIFFNWLKLSRHIKGFF
jgi:hypothetical protein